MPDEITAFDLADSLIIHICDIEIVHLKIEIVPFVKENGKLWALMDLSKTAC
jgi:hypothetical protein